MKNKIIYAADPNFIQFALTSIYSAYLNGNNGCDFFILHQKEHKEKISEALNKAPNSMPSIHLLTVDGEIFSNWKASKTLTTTAYLRLLIPDLFPTSEKVLYIDCDTLILSNLDELFDANLSNNSIAGVLDDIEKNNLDHPLNNNYINSGVLLMNCKNLSRDNFLSKTKYIYENYEDKIIYHDQCLINYYMAGESMLLSERWNKMIRLNKINSDEWISILNESPKIIHFAGRVKPWMSWSNRAVTAHWLAYANLAGFDSKSIKQPSSAYEMLLQANSYENENDFERSSEIKSKIINLLSATN